MFTNILAYMSMSNESNITTDNIYLTNESARLFRRMQADPNPQIITVARRRMGISFIATDAFISSRNGDLISSSYVSVTLPPINATPIIENRPTEQIIYRKIKCEKEQCVISYSKIKPKCKYWQCDECNNAVIFSHINTWFQSHNTCPACRKEYNFSRDGITYYINSDKNNKPNTNNC